MSELLLENLMRQSPLARYYLHKERWVYWSILQS